MAEILEVLKKALEKASARSISATARMRVGIVGLGRNVGRFRWLGFALLVGIALYALLFAWLGHGLLSRSDYGSYTLQARAWLSGRVDLERDYPHLELASYRGRIFVSFPPLPSLVILPLAAAFGARTPDNLLVAIYGLLALVAAYALGRRIGLEDFPSAFWTFFLVFGSNMVECTVNGGVWYQAQALSFLLSLLALLALEYGGRRALSLALAFLAMAVGCRPLQLIWFPLFVPGILKALGIRRPVALAAGAEGEAPPVRRRSWSRILGAAFVISAPFVIIGASYGVYNLVRFGNPLEFGHRYLPEYSGPGIPVFSISYVKANLANILRLPKIVAGPRLDMPRFNGMAFWLANPFFLSLGISMALAWWRIARKKSRLEAADIIFPVCFFLHALATLAHNTLGGWQFGLRYFIDLLPFAFWYSLKRRAAPCQADYFIALAAVPFQVYGALWLFLNWK